MYAQALSRVNPWQLPGTWWDAWLAPTVPTRSLSRFKFQTQRAHETAFTVGDSALLIRNITTEDISAYVGVSGDDNRVHTDAAFAASTAFKGCIAQGMLSASGFGAIFGHEYPGQGTIYLSQNLVFKKAVRPGDEVVYDVELEDIRDSRAGRIGMFACRAFVREELLVIEGSATLLLP